MSRAKEFRNNAEMLRGRAQTATNSQDRANWLEIAQHWENLAREAEKYPDAFPIGNGT
jgi:hypothetical protein